MKIKIDGIEHISLIKKLQIVIDYMYQNTINGQLIQTRKDVGTKIESCGSRYHVTCHKTDTMWVFYIWWAV